MKICLINPPHPYLKQPYSQAPLGLMYIASALRTKNTDVCITDLSGQKYDEEFDIPFADIYGITGTVVDRMPCEVVAKTLKKKYPKCKVIVGGPLSLSKDQLDKTVIDSVVIGEGERIIFDIIDDYPNMKDTYTAERITDLDSLVFPARDMMEHNGGNIFAYNKNYSDGGSTVFISSRGCPYNCSFCASPGIWHRNVTFRSSENVLAEVDEIVEKYNIKQLRFSDDTFTLKRDRLFKICKGLG